MLQRMTHRYPKTVLPAEWAEQSGMQLTWPHAKTDWAPCLAEVTETFVRLARTIARHERLLVVTPEPEAVQRLLQIPDVIYLQCDTNDTWARDHGPLTLLGPDGAEIVDFKFNGWGEKFPWQLDNAITRHLYDAGLLRGRYVDATDFVLEGGSIESDGEGTLLTTTHCLLAPHRNQPLGKTDIEEQLKQRLHAERVIWLDHGQIIGDDTDGHIDTMARLAPDRTIVYQGAEEGDEQFAELKAMEDELKETGYRLLRLPPPPLLTYDGERLPATYANFVIINGCVIVPTYGDEARDREAMAVIKEAFPDREIVGIDASVVVRQHGSLHCLSMQYPAGVIG